MYKTIEVLVAAEYTQDINKILQHLHERRIVESWTLKRNNLLDAPRHQIPLLVPEYTFIINIDMRVLDEPI